MSLRIGLVTRMNLAEVIRTSIKSKIVNRFIILLIISSILIGNTAYEAGNITGASLGISAIINYESINYIPVFIGLIAFVILYQGDYKILEKSTIAGEPIGSVKVKYVCNLKPFKVEGDILPKLIDEIPILTVAACFCSGVSEIKDAKELRVKETDRLKVMATQLKKFGANIIEKEDGLIINGDSKFHSAEVDTEPDHRVSMSLAIASLLAKGSSKIARAEASRVSYPNFWDDLEKLIN